MKVGVFGLGRFGRFWAEQLALRFPVVAYNRSKRDIELRGVDIVEFEHLVTCDVIFICTAISSLREVLTRLAPSVRKDALIIDTCSVKVYPKHLMQDLLPESVSIIATHPMFGPDSGKDGVQGLPIMMDPLRCTQETSVYWSETFRSMGLEVMQMSCDQHDREAAYSQGVTHFVGRMLDELKLQKTQLATVGYTKLLEIVEQTCNDPLQLFLDLQRYNPYAQQMHSELNSAISTILALLTRMDDAPMEDL